MNLKQKIFAFYLQQVNDKVAMLQKVLADLKESGTNETKSTAGDKHETALAMLQIEQANVRGQLNEAFLQRTALEKINPEFAAAIIMTGSLVKTNRGYFFMSIALGKSLVDGIEVIAVSPQSPLGAKMMGLKPGENIAMNETPYIIEDIA